MERVFLDANVLFSAAYSGKSGLSRLWGLHGIDLITSHYAVYEAQPNLPNEEQKSRLIELLSSITVIKDVLTECLPEGVNLPEKDWPILIGAIESRAAFLVTGDRQDFGHLYGKEVCGVRILKPAEFLKRF